MMKSEGGGGVVDGGGGEKDGQFFVDQTTGQYYFQSNDGETMTMVDENDTEATAGPSGTNKLSKLCMQGVPLLQACFLNTFWRPSRPNRASYP